MSTTSRNIQPGLIAIGLCLIAIGAVTFLLMGWHTATADAGLAGGALPAQTVSPQWPSRIWPVVAGLLLAAGAAITSIGLNRWFGHRK